MVEQSDNESARARILEAATRLFGQQGYAATSVRQVVEAAGVTKPTLYYYFDNKEALFREAVMAQLNGLSMLIDMILAAEGDGRQRCRMFLEAFVGGGMMSQDNVRLMLAASTGLEDGQPRIPLTTEFWGQIQRLNVLFERDAEVAVAMLVGTGTELLFRALEGIDPPEDFADRVVGILFDGVTER